MGCCRCSDRSCCCTVTEAPTRQETTEPALEEPTSPPQRTTRPGYTICRENACLSPDSSGEIYCTLEAQEDVEVLSMEGNWCCIRLDERECFLPAASVREKSAPNGYTVVIDPGHQRYGNSAQEPDGPGSSTMKAKVTTGTQGRTTGLAEYELDLLVGLKLRTELENRGYTVIMTRESSDVDLSNSQRATIANEADADVFIRLHANGSENSSVQGAMTICQTSANPYNSALYPQSRALSDSVLEAFVAATGCNRQNVWETDTMSGINWCQVPTTILEMGYMTNPEEDTLLSTEAYQYKMVQGIANGIDHFLAEQNGSEG